MSLVYIGIFFMGIMASATAALYAPKKKVDWENASPKVKTSIRYGDKHDKC